MNPTKSLIVGTGVIAPHHLAAIRGLGDEAVVVGAVEPVEGRREAFGDEYGVQVFASLEEAIVETTPDLVHLCTPPVLHTDQAILALESGASVFCEKPLTDSLANLDKLEAVEAASSGHLVTVCQWRFGSAAVALRAAMARDEYGKLLTGLCHTMFYRDQAYYDVAWRGRWESELGGATTTNGTHAIDLVLSLKPDWSKVSAFTGTVAHDIEVEDVAMAAVGFADGAVMSFGASTASPRQETLIRLDFEKATVDVNAEYRYSNENWRFTPAPGASAVAAPWDGKVDVTSTHGAQLRAVVDALRSGQRPPATIDEVRPTVEFLASLYKSAATGASVERGQIGPDDPFYFGNLAGMRSLAAKS